MAQHRKDYTEAVRLYGTGLSIGQVAERFGISRQAMYVILKRRGVAFRGNLKYGAENHFFRGTKAVDAAQNLLERAIEHGHIDPPTRCSQCGAMGSFRDGRRMIQAHHDDYNKPMDVRWLCQRCHHEWHKHNKARGANKVGKGTVAVYGSGGRVVGNEVSSWMANRRDG